MEASADPMQALSPELQVGSQGFVWGLFSMPALQLPSLHSETADRHKAPWHRDQLHHSAAPPRTYEALLWRRRNDEPILGMLLRQLLIETQKVTEPPLDRKLLAPEHWHGGLGGGEDAQIRLTRDPCEHSLAAKICCHVWGKGGQLELCRGPTEQALAWPSSNCPPKSSPWTQH